MACVNSGDVPCGTIGCRNPERCCQADIGYGCATGATCYTTTGSIGCWRSGRALPAGPAPCFDYSAAMALTVDCGTYSWCDMCTSTQFPSCNTIVITGTAPITAIYCDVTGGVSTYTGGAATTPTGPAQPPSGSSTTTPSSTGPVTRPPPPPASTFPGIPAPTTPPPAVTTTPPGGDNGGGDGGGLSTGAIAGIAIGGLFAIAIIALLAFFLWRRERTASPPPPPQQQPPVVQYQHQLPHPQSPPPGYPPYQDAAGYAYVQQGAKGAPVPARAAFPVHEVE